MNVFSTKVLIGDTIFMPQYWRVRVRVRVRDRNFTWSGSEPREGPVGAAILSTITS